MYPTLEKVKEIAASGEYRRIPVCKELYADRYTPVEVMRVLRKASKHCYLLESASQTEVWGRFSFLGYEPAMEITCTDGLLNIRKTGEDAVVTKVVQDMELLATKLDHLVIVTNNVFEDGIPYDEGTMAYLRALGRINTVLAKRADRVVEVVVGIPVILKESAQERTEE